MCHKGICSSKTITRINSVSANILMPNISYTCIHDPLLDGQQCEGTCCTGANSPQWFSVQLPAPTTDMTEVSICCDKGTDDEDILVELHKKPGHVKQSVA